MNILEQLGKWASTTRKRQIIEANHKARQKMNPHPTDLQPVKFRIAGAEMTCNGDGFQGRFHTIPDTLWDCIIGFHRQVSINLSAESVSYHRWHEPTQQYHSLIPWQTTSSPGLSVNVNWRDERNTKLLDEYARQFGVDFFPACTIHTHVDSSAFESGTDAADERENPGWHITLGKLVSNERYHFDFRARLPALSRLKAVADTGRAYKLGWNHLFVPNPEREAFVHTTPGTTDWHRFLERVVAR